MSGNKNAHGKHDFGVEAEPTHFEQYANTFKEFQRYDDHCRWVGMGTRIEFPHNPGALEEKVDRAQEKGQK